MKGGGCNCLNLCFALEVELKIQISLGFIKVLHVKKEFPMYFEYKFNVFFSKSRKKNAYCHESSQNRKKNRKHESLKTLNE